MGVITALTVSLVEAFLVLPHHLRHSLHKMRKEPRPVRRLEQALDHVNAEFKPYQPDRKDLIRTVSTSYGFVRTLGDQPGKPESGSHLAQVFVEMLTADVRRKARCDDVLAVWREKTGPVADVTRLTFRQMRVTPGGKPIDVRLKGDDLDQLKTASLDLQERLDPSTANHRGYPGVYNVDDNLRPGKLQLDVQLKPAGRNLGISSGDLARQLREAFWGSIAEEFQRGADAVTLAGMQRLRPVLLISATTVAGLMPMMLETSLQAQFLVPMAISIAFGLMFATVVVLVLVPSLYSILARLGWTQKIEPE